jgi:deoxyribonuclease-4
MIKIGVAGIPSCCKSFESGIEWLGKNNLQEEVQFVRQIWMKPARAKEIKKLAKKSKVELSVHAPYYINLNSLKKQTIGMSKSYIIRSAELAHLMGAKIVVFHAGYYVGKSPAETYKRMKKELEYIAEKLKEKGIKDVELGIETMGKQKSFGTLEECLNLSQEVDFVRPVLDFAHLHARENGRFKVQKDFSDLFEKVDKTIGLKDHMHGHFTGIYYEKGNEKHHLTLDDGDLKFELLAKELKQRKVDMTIICESPVLENDALKMLKIVKR